MSLITQIGDCINAVNWADIEHDRWKLYFGALIKEYDVTDFETEVNYANNLALKVYYAVAAMHRMCADVLGLSSTTLDNYTKTTLADTPFLGTKHVPLNWTNGGHDYFLTYRYAQTGRMYQLAKDWSHETAKWDSLLAWQELKGVFQAAGNVGVLGADPRDNSYYLGNNRFYDENAESLAALLELYEVDKANNGDALTYARDTLWAYINATHWSVNHYNYTPTWTEYECEGAFFPLIIARLRALNGYTLTDWDRILTDIKSRFLNDGWNAPQWTFGTTKYYCVVHKHEDNSQRRLSNTFGAWVTLHAFYQILDSTSKTNFRNLLDGATKAWQFLRDDSTLFDVATDKFRDFSDYSVSDSATSRGIVIFWLLGIVPQTGSLYVPIYEFTYESYGLLNKNFSFDYANRVIRLPIKAGEIKFIYGTTPVTQNFTSNGVYDITFAADWNSITNVTKVGGLDTSLLYVTQPAAEYTIAGITRDAGGNPLGACTVWLFRTSDKSFVSSTPSDGNGNYSFPVGDNTTQYFVRAYKDGTPNVFGTTDRNLVGS